MALSFNPPDWLIQDYLAKQNQNPIAESLNQVANQYIQFDTNRRRNETLAAETENRKRETDLKGREQFFKYGDPTGLPPEIAQSIGQPAQGPATEQGAPPAMSPVLRAFNDFHSKYPQGTEGAGLENKLGANQNSLDEITAQQVRDGKITLEQAYRMKNPASSTANTKPPVGYKWLPDGSLAPIPGGPVDTKSSKEDDKLKSTLELYDTARDGLISGLEGSVTGPMAGRIPAVTSAQQTAEGGVAAMAPVLKQLFRVSGEGVFTDRDQALLLDMVPTRKDHPEARRKKIENIDAIVKAKLGMGKSGAFGGGQSTPTVGGTFEGKRIKNVTRVQ